jgi:hypothetical protein
MRKVLALHFLQIVTTTDDIKGLILSHPSFQVKHALAEISTGFRVPTRLIYEKAREESFVVSQF